MLLRLRRHAADAPARTKPYRPNPIAAPGRKFSEMKCSIVLLVLAATVPLHAHDFWIEPSTFRPAVGTMLTASLRVGQDFLGDPVPRSAELIDSFTIRDGKGQRAVAGLEGRDPAGFLRIEAPGIAIVGYQSKANPLELPAAKFEQFLADEGFDSIRALRAKRGQSGQPDHEHFFRYAKALLQSGSGDGARLDQPLGFRYEIVPLNDPMATAGETAFRVLHEAKPLAGALVMAMHRDDPSLRLRARTDAKGRVAFNLPKNGVWLIRSVHMVAAPAGSGADWESLWASLTFER